MNEELFFNNTRLISFVIKKMELRYNLEEWYRVGEIGLIKAVQTFDPNKNYKFSTYAIKCIQYEISHHLQYEGRQKRRNNNLLLSLDETIDENNNIQLLDTIDNGENLEEDLLKKEKIDLLYKIISILEPNDRFILEHYYELKNCQKMNQKELAKALGVKQYYISRRIKRSLRIIKKIMEDKIENCI